MPEATRFAVRTRGETEVISAGHGFLEGPRWHAGRLYASDMSDRKVLSWAPEEGPVRLCTVPGRPSGIGWTRSGDLLVVSMEDRRVLRLGPSGLVEHADLSRTAPWHLNDMVTDSSGGAYVGNLGWDDERDDEIHETILIYVGLNRAPKVVADGLVNPNGMALSADGHTLLVNETFAARTTAFDVAPDGSLRNRRVWADYAGEKFSRVSEALASGAILPDGIALDRDGAAWIGDCRGSGAVRVAEGGQVLDFVSTGEHAAFAVALGSDDGRTLYICTAPAYDANGLTPGDGAMCSVQVEVPGVGH